MVALPSSHHIYTRLSSSPPHNHLSKPSLTNSKTVLTLQTIHDRWLTSINLPASQALSAQKKILRILRTQQPPILTPVQTAPLYINIALLRAFFGEYYLAAETFTDALKLDPDNAIALYGLGCARFLLDDWSAARRAWTLCIRCFGPTLGGEEESRETRGGRGVAMPLMTDDDGEAATKLLLRYRVQNLWKQGGSNKQEEEWVLLRTRVEWNRRFARFQKKRHHGGTSQCEQLREKPWGVNGIPAGLILGPGFDIHGNNMAHLIAPGPAIIVQPPLLPGLKSAPAPTLPFIPSHSPPTVPPTCALSSPLPRSRTTSPLSLTRLFMTSNKQLSKTFSSLGGRSRSNSKPELKRPLTPPTSSGANFLPSTIAVAAGGKSSSLPTLTGMPRLPLPLPQPPPAQRITKSQATITATATATTKLAAWPPSRRVIPISASRATIVGGAICRSSLISGDKPGTLSHHPLPLSLHHPLPLPLHHPIENPTITNPIPSPSSLYSTTIPPTPRPRPRTKTPTLSTTAPTTTAATKTWHSSPSRPRRPSNSSSPDYTSYLSTPSPYTPPHPHRNPFSNTYSTPSPRKFSSSPSPSSSSSSSSSTRQEPLPSHSRGRASTAPIMEPWPERSESRHAFLKGRRESSSCSNSNSGWGLGLDSLYIDDDEEEEDEEEEEEEEEGAGAGANLHGAPVAVAVPVVTSKPPPTFFPPPSSININNPSPMPSATDKDPSSSSSIKCKAAVVENKMEDGNLEILLPRVFEGFLVGGRWGRGRW